MSIGGPHEVLPPHGSVPCSSPLPTTARSSLCTTTRLRQHNEVLALATFSSTTSPPWWHCQVVPTLDRSDIYALPSCQRDGRSSEGSRPGTWSRRGLCCGRRSALARGCSGATRPASRRARHQPNDSAKTAGPKPLMAGWVLQLPQSPVSSLIARAEEESRPSVDGVAKSPLFLSRWSAGTGKPRGHAPYMQRGDGIRTDSHGVSNPQWPDHRHRAARSREFRKG